MNIPWLMWGNGKDTVLVITEKRKNLFDLRRLAVVHNLHVIDRMKQPIEQQQA